MCLCLARRALQDDVALTYLPGTVVVFVVIKTTSPGAEKQSASPLSRSTEKRKLLKEAEQCAICNTNNVVLRKQDPGPIGRTHVVTPKTGFSGAEARDATVPREAYIPGRSEEDFRKQRPPPFFWAQCQPSLFLRTQQHDGIDLCLFGERSAAIIAPRSLSEGTEARVATSGKLAAVPRRQFPRHEKKENSNRR